MLKQFTYEIFYTDASTSCSENDDIWLDLEIFIWLLMVSMAGIFSGILNFWLAIFWPFLGVNWQKKQILNGHPAGSYPVSKQNQIRGANDTFVKGM